MHNKIKKIAAKEKGILKDTKGLIKADIAMDKKVAKCGSKMKKKGKK